MVQKSGKLTSWGWVVYVYPIIYEVLAPSLGGWPDFFHQQYFDEFDEFLGWDPGQDYLPGSLTAPTCPWKSAESQEEKCLNQPAFCRGELLNHGTWN